MVDMLSLVAAGVLVIAFIVLLLGSIIIEVL